MAWGRACGMRRPAGSTFRGARAANHREQRIEQAVPCLAAMLCPQFDFLGDDEYGEDEDEE